MADVFVIGDVVVLKSGGPKMTVHNIGDYSMSGGTKNGAFCKWFEGSTVKSEVFNVNSLMKAD
jgi:uncharacterized protein YodC (DUF2158 family)